MANTAARITASVRITANCVICNKLDNSIRPHRDCQNFFPSQKKYGTESLWICITSLPPVKDKRIIKVVVDSLCTDISMLNWSHLNLRQTFIMLHGVPNGIVSDRGTTFLSKFWMELFCQKGTALSHGVAYHPNSDGQTQVISHFLDDDLRCFVTKTHRDRL